MNTPTRLGRGSGPPTIAWGPGRVNKRPKGRPTGPAPCWGGSWHAATPPASRSLSSLNRRWHPVEPHPVVAYGRSELGGRARGRLRLLSLILATGSRSHCGQPGASTGFLGRHTGYPTAPRTNQRGYGGQGVAREHSPELPIGPLGAERRRGWPASGRTDEAGPSGSPARTGLAAGRSDSRSRHRTTPPGQAGPGSSASPRRRSEPAAEGQRRPRDRPPAPRAARPVLHGRARATTNR